mgnify:CR=1 FL=1|jgi:hypothetical protein
MEDYNEYLEENEYVVEELETQNSNLNLEEKSLAKNYFVEYINLRSEYNDLIDAYDKLKLEYNENTVIESMNDMRDRYNALVESTVSLNKYNKLTDKYNKTMRTIASIPVFLEYILILFKDLEGRLMFEDKKELYKAETQIIIIKEIIEDLTKK